MTTTRELLARVKNPDNIVDRLLENEKRIDAVVRTEVAVTEVDQLTSDLGLMTSGEFRAGNGVEPGNGFTGMRMVYPSVEYDGIEFNLVGVNNDEMQFGGSASDGTFVAGEGNVVLSRTGIYAILGSIGGWELGADFLQKNNITICSAGYITVGTGNDIVRIDSTDVNYRIWAGNSSASSSPFRVGKDGSIYSVLGIIAGWTISSTKISKTGIEIDSSVPKIVIGSASGIELNGASGVIRSNNYSAGFSGFKFDYLGSAEFDNIVARGAIKSSVFEYGEITSFAGKLRVSKSAGVIEQDYTVGGTLYIKANAGGGWAFETNDIIEIKSLTSGGVSDTFIRVTRDGVTINKYSTTYMYGTNSVTYLAGTAANDTGQANNGWIDIEVDSGSPRMRMITSASVPWSDGVERIRIGNLRDFLSLSRYTGSNLYGIGIGDANHHLTYDPTHGLRIKGNIITGAGSGYVCDPAFHAKYDGAKPFETNFTGNFTGHFGQTPVVAGGAIFRKGKFGKALQSAAATTNYVSNPSFEVNVTDYWTYAPASSGSQVSNGAFGSKCLQMTTGTSGGGYIYGANAVAVAAAVGDVFTASAFVKKTSLASSINIGFVTYTSGGTYVGTRISANLVSQCVLGEWSLITYTYTLAGTEVRVSPYVSIAGASSGLVTGYIDGIQMEKKSYNTPYCDGSLGTGHSWSGTAHNSSSSRTASSVKYDISNVNQEKGTWMGWVHPLAAIGANKPLIDCRDASNLNAPCLLVGDTSVYFYVGAVITSYAISHNTWTHIAATYDFTADQYKLYINGDLVDSDTGALSQPSYGGYMWVGCNYGAGSQMNGFIDELTTFDTVLSDDDIYAVYNSGVPIVVAKEGSILLNGKYGEGYIYGDNTGLYAKNSDGVIQSYFSNIGDFIFGDENVVINSLGITIENAISGTPYPTGTQIKFGLSDTVHSKIYGVVNARYGFGDLYIENVDSGAALQFFGSACAIHAYSDFKVNFKFGANGSTPLGKQTFTITSSGSTADSTYSTNEVNLINALKTEMSALKTILQNFGFIA